MDNQRLRVNMRQWREGLSSDVIAKKSQSIMSHIQDFFLQTMSLDGILCYYPTRGEVDLRPLYAALLQRDYALFFPVTGRDEITFYRVQGMSDFHPGRFGILEPTSMEELPEGGHYLSFVPGLLFSTEGERVGYGGGYYDRFFASHSEVIRVGVCFDEQLSREITVMDWDIPMHYVATESMVYTNI